MQVWGLGAGFGPPFVMGDCQMKPKLRCVIWAAVSTPAQAADEKDSIPSQIAEAERFINSEGWQIVKTLIVPGHTRDYLFFRDAMEDVKAYRELYALCEAKAFDWLVVRDRSRLGRSDPLISQVEGLCCSDRPVRIDGRRWLRYGRGNERRTGVRPGGRCRLR